MREDCDYLRIGGYITLLLMELCFLKMFARDAYAVFITNFGMVLES